MSDEFRAYSPGELIEKVDADFRARRCFHEDGVVSDTAWNGWRLDSNRFVLDLIDSEGRFVFEVDLEKSFDSAHMLNSLVQVYKKAWARRDPKLTAGLLCALDDVFDLQSNVCREDAHRALTMAQAQDLVSAYLQKFEAGVQP